MLPSAGTSGVVCANWTCEDFLHFLHFAETVAVLVLGGRPQAQTMRWICLSEGAGPGIMGAAVQPGTSAAPAILTACVVALDKYCQGTGAPEHEPAWKREYETRGLNPHEIK
eukprot:jgi/Tetstr1/455933/TSEL_042714.t1